MLRFARTAFEEVSPGILPTSPHCGHQFRPNPAHNRPISAQSQGVGSLRASATILERRLESRLRQLREAPLGDARRNISSTC